MDTQDAIRYTNWVSSTHLPLSLVFLDIRMCVALVP